MSEVPECLSKRYEAAANLMQQINATQDSRSGSSEEDPAVQLLCTFWNILQEYPDLNLTEVVKEQLNLQEESFAFNPQRFACFVASTTNTEGRRDVMKPQSSQERTGTLHRPHLSACLHDFKRGIHCYQTQDVAGTYNKSAKPLSKVLCSLNEAASFGKKCNVRAKELKATQKQLLNQISGLEDREKEGIKLLKQAESMWASMEEVYKNKIEESLKRQEGLIKQLKAAEASNTKWRKNKKDLEVEINNLDKCYKEIIEKFNQKTNDLKSIKIEVDYLKKKSVRNKKDIEAATKLSTNRKNASDAKISEITTKVITLEEQLKEEQLNRNNKEKQGSRYLKEARNDFQNISKILVQKKLENDNLSAERDSIRAEIESLTVMFDLCNDKCGDRGAVIQNEIDELDKQIKEFKLKCVKCHQMTDTVDIKTFCTDCPKCLKARECKIIGDCCTNKSMDCVCLYVKRRFMGNVFKSMGKVLDDYIKGEPGIKIADSVLHCLKQSRNGKLDPCTRRELQRFIQSNIKKKLDTAIIGGALKTRCEMDEDTYKQLMLCLKEVPTPQQQNCQLTKSDKGTAARKKPCPYLNDSSECNCPKGFFGCACGKFDPKPSRSPSSRKKPLKKNDGGASGGTSQNEVSQRQDSKCLCPNASSKSKRETGPQRQSAIQNVLTLSEADYAYTEANENGTNVTSWQLKVCQEPTCQFKSMRAVQCVLGHEVLSSDINSEEYVTASNNSSILAEPTVSKGIREPALPCQCTKDYKNEPRDQIIEEVLGSSYPVPPVNMICHCGGHLAIPCNCNKDTQQLKAVTTNLSNKRITSSNNGGKKINAHESTGRSIDQIKDINAHKNINRSIIFDKSKNKSNKTNKINFQVKENSQNDNRLSSVSKELLINLKKSLDKNILKLLQRHTNNNLAHALILEVEKPIPNQTFKISSSNVADLTSDGKSTKYVLENVSFSISKDKKHELKVEFRNLNNKVSGYLCRTPYFATITKDYLNKTNNVEIAKEKQVVCVSIKELESNVRESRIDSISELKIQGHDIADIKSFFLIRKKCMRDYEIVLNKEYETNIKNTIKCYEFNHNVSKGYVFKIIETTNGIIEIEPEHESNSHLKSAIVFRTSSGNVRLVTFDPNEEKKKLELDDSCSIITPLGIRKLIKKLYIGADDARKRRTYKKESLSDSDIYQKAETSLKENLCIESNRKIYLGENNKVIKKPLKTIYERQYCKTVWEDFKASPLSLDTHNFDPHEVKEKVSQKHIENLYLQKPQKIYLWKALELLPPQLPPILQGCVNNCMCMSSFDGNNVPNKN